MSGFGEFNRCVLSSVPNFLARLTLIRSLIITDRNLILCRTRECTGDSLRTYSASLLKKLLGGPDFKVSEQRHAAEGKEFENNLAYMSK